MTNLQDMHIGLFRSLELGSLFELRALNFELSRRPLCRARREEAQGQAWGMQEGKFKVQGSNKRTKS
jgi:hypothetical protein